MQPLLFRARRTSRWTSLPSLQLAGLQIREHRKRPVQMSFTAAAARVAASSQVIALATLAFFSCRGTFAGVESTAVNARAVLGSGGCCGECRG